MGKIIDAGTTAVANRVLGVSFELQNELPSRTRALQQAVEEAKTKAQALAKALDLKLSLIRRVQEGPVSIIRPPFPLAATARMAAAMPNPVEPGELKIQATVTVDYDIRPAHSPAP